MEMKQPNNRRTLLFALAFFLIPVIAAAVLHKTGWYQSVGTNNNGQLITPPVPFESISLLGADNHTVIDPITLQKKWWMVYVMPAQCDSACNNSLFQMRQIHLALGPDQHRVSTLLIATNDIPENLQQTLNTEFPHMMVTRTTKANLESAFAVTTDTQLQNNPSERIFLVDTMGAVFMYFLTYPDEQQSILKGRELLRDLQRVLKLSKIG